VVFDSITFFIFFAIFLVAYYACSRWFRLQNVVLLIGSYIFYGWWDWRFLGLMTLSSGVDYVAGLLLARDGSTRSRKLVLIASLGTNLTILFAFKYFGFFADSLHTTLTALGIDVALPVLRVVLPVGISFYTFQSMAYTVDVYRRDTAAERDPVVFFTFISFFPQLVAGPIERAEHLLQQVRRPRRLTAGQVREAVWLLAWGFFLKEAVADAAAPFADVAFHAQQDSGWTTILGTIAFALQIYCDFCAYSVIARGTAKLLGIELMWNFRHPYFATSVADFWHRWHISLSTWLRDYLYIPLGGSRRGERRTYVNLMAVMLLGGLWHGAAWNFVLWGAWHGAALVTERAARRTFAWRPPAAITWPVTMVVVLVGWLMFRSTSMEMLLGMLGALDNLRWDSRHSWMAISLLWLAAPVMLIELWQYRRDDLLVAMRLGTWRFAMLTAVLTTSAVVMFDRFRYAFIYFQF
jgi:alginate O-acetyltransferase complex protein AlgI